MSKKKAKDIISMDMIAELPSTKDISNALDFVGGLQRIPTMREFHASNIDYAEMETALTGLSGAFFTGKSSSKYITKLKKIKSSTNLSVSEDDFI